MFDERVLKVKQKYDTTIITNDVRQRCYSLNEL